MLCEAPEIRRALPEIQSSRIQRGKEHQGSRSLHALHHSIVLTTGITPIGRTVRTSKDRQLSEAAKMAITHINLKTAPRPPPRACGESYALTHALVARDARKTGHSVSEAGSKDPS